ncbi:Ig-like domain-containing protein [Methylobacterium durans]|uniref:Ig-like domain-containing protein n=1 Tax=Methylobacterium durans TaxID=2202825 RepID=UPI001F213EFD|nr:Ig-like domain-containing protein [Methylobacterium durans]
MTGTAEAGASVTVTSGALVLGTVTADATGTFTFTPSVPLPNGTSNLVATARDAAGNLSPASDPVSVAIDTRVPGAPTVNYLPPTNDPTPIISGNAAAGDTVVISLDGVEIGRTVAGAGGAFAIEVTPIPEGSRTLSIVATSPTGTPSPAATLAVLVDLTPRPLRISPPSPDRRTTPRP